MASGGWLGSSKIWTSSSFAEETSCTCTILGRLLGGGVTGWELPGRGHTICLATGLGASPFACWGEPRWSWLKLHCRASPAGAGGAWLSSPSSQLLGFLGSFDSHHLLHKFYKSTLFKCSSAKLSTTKSKELPRDYEFQHIYKN